MGREISKRRIWSAVAIMVVLLAAVLVWGLFFKEPAGRVFHQFKSPDEQYVITVYRYAMPFAMPGGGGSDAPGRIELTTADGRLLHREPVPMVFMAMEEPEWGEKEVRLGGLLKSFTLQ